MFNVFYSLCHLKEVWLPIKGLIQISFPSWHDGRLIIKMAQIVPLLGSTAFAIQLYSTSHQKVEAISISFEYCLALWFALANRMQQKGSSANCEPRPLRVLGTSTCSLEGCLAMRKKAQIYWRRRNHQTEEFPAKSILDQPSVSWPSNT